MLAKHLPDQERVVHQLAITTNTAAVRCFPSCHSAHPALHVTAMLPMSKYSGMASNRCLHHAGIPNASDGCCVVHMPLFAVYYIADAKHVQHEYEYGFCSDYKRATVGSAATGSPTGEARAAVTN